MVQVTVHRPLTAVVGQPSKELRPPSQPGFCWVTIPYADEVGQQSVVGGVTLFFETYEARVAWVENLLAEAAAVPYTPTHEGAI